MRRLFIISLFLLLLVAVAQAQFPFLAKPNLDKPQNPYPGLAANGVSEIVLQGDSLIWLATGAGLCLTQDFGYTFESYYPDLDSLPRGGISAIAVLDSVVWVAGIFDSTTELGDLQTGGGLAYSRDWGKNWIYVPQPLDGRYDSTASWGGYPVNFLPIVTPIKNTTWDIAITSQYVYIVSWGGGIRRSLDFGRTWERIPLPKDDMELLTCGPIDYKINPRDPPQGGYHNHKGFSVLAYGDTLWIGTANGINRGIISEDGCIDWQHYNAQNSGISGNFVVSLGRQVYRGRETIWAGTLPTDDPTEYRAISKSSDGGVTWTTTLTGEWAFNFAFYDSIAYVCTENGLFKTIDGENWAVYRNIVDQEKNDFIFSHYVYSAAVDIREGRTFLWLGSSDGVAKTADDGLNWQIFRSVRPIKVDDQERIYAYPNPFSPTRHNVLDQDGHVRIVCEIGSPGNVRLEIFNFAMEQVFQGGLHPVSMPGGHSEVWNGRNGRGEWVANGTYFCKISIGEESGKREYWTKLIVIK